MKEVDQLLALLEACHQVLDRLDQNADDEISQAIRETCRLVEARLDELGIRPNDLSQTG